MFVCVPVCKKIEIIESNNLFVLVGWHYFLSTNLHCLFIVSQLWIRIVGEGDRLEIQCTIPTLKDVAIKLTISSKSRDFKEVIWIQML